MIHIREYAWPDYDAVVRLWTATGTKIVPRPELEAKLTRDPELMVLPARRRCLAEQVSS